MIVSAFCGLFFPRSIENSGAAAASEQVAECRDDNDQRKAQADRAERRRSHIWDPRDVNAVYDVVQKA